MDKGLSVACEEIKDKGLEKKNLYIHKVVYETVFQTEIHPQMWFFSKIQDRLEWDWWVCEKHPTTLATLYCTFIIITNKLNQHTG